MFITRSLSFYPGNGDNNSQELSDEIIIPSYHLNKLINQFAADERLYLNMINTETQQQYLVAFGSSHNYDKNIIYAPQWILELIGCSGCCDSIIKLEKADISNIPIATKITIKPLDPIAFELDTLEIFEKALINIHSIKENITIPISVPQLDDSYTLFAYIEKVEPMSISRIVDGEVEVEFINDFTMNNTATTPIAPIHPIITPNSTPNSTPILASSMIDTSAISSISSLQADFIPVEERRKNIRESWAKRFKSE
jgi:hypothetical protein